MIIRVCFFSENGAVISDKLNSELSDDIVIVKAHDDNTDDFVRMAFEKKSPLVFIGACGIAVRKISPFVDDKLTDIPVIVIDEKGRYVIPILSGHVGGANRMALRISKLLGAEAVCTTATDVEGLFAIDVFAVDNGLEIVNREGIKTVSSKLLRGENITLAVDQSFDTIISRADLQGEIIPVANGGGESVDVMITDKAPDGSAALYLKPKRYAIGVGCKLGTDVETVKQKIAEAAQLMGLSFDELIADSFTIATIDLKKKEQGLWEFAQIHKLQIRFFDANELMDVTGDFSESEFVKSITGVSNVCERSAVLAASGISVASKASAASEHGTGRLVLGKIAGDGVTVAVAARF